MPSDRERVAADPALLAAVRARYAGSADVLDVLWWLERPGEPTPAGVEDPAAAAQRDRVALYRPGAPASAAAGVRAAERSIAADRAAARSAVEEALAARRLGSRGPARARRSRPLVAVALAALLAGGALGALLAGPQAGTPAALAVFDRAQRPEDRPPTSAPLPDGIAVPTLRLLGTSSASGTEVFAARSDDGRVCLVAVVLALEFHSTCTSEAAFRLDGLRVAYDARVDPADLSGAVRVQEIAASWAPNGALRF